MWVAWIPACAGMTDSFKDSLVKQTAAAFAWFAFDFESPCRAFGLSGRWIAARTV
jgi:hypothetical protein